MPRIARALSALEVQRLTDKPGMHFVGTVPGLILQVSSAAKSPDAPNAASWIFRTTIGGKRRDIGLGSYPKVTLAKAHALARETSEKIGKGVDPIVEKREARSKLSASRLAVMPFSEAAQKYIEAFKSGWRNPKSAAQWAASLETYAFPFIGAVGVADIELAHIKRVLDPIWTTKTETASRVRGRIENILDWCTVQGFRKGENPARWRGHLEHLLAARSDVAEVEHHAALPWREIGAFMPLLRKVEGMGARALEFSILCAARSGEVRGATWGEIDLELALWTIPASRMKAKREHVIPLSSGAVALLRSLPRVEGCDVVFPNTKGTPLSDATLTAVLKRMGVAVTAHGFRSTFRDWGGESSSYPREVVEHALAHQLADKAEAAYQRGTLLDKRRRLMQSWFEFCNAPAVVASITPIRSAEVAA